MGCWQRPHHAENAPVLVRSPKLSSVGLGQYMDGRPPGNTFMQVRFSFSFCFSCFCCEELEVETERDSDANLMRVGLGKGRRGREGEALESRRIYPTDVGNSQGRQKASRRFLWLENIFSEL